MKSPFISFRIKFCFRIMTVLLFLAIAIPVRAQQFKVVEDTIRINVADYISPISEFTMKWSAKYHGFYFCIFEDQQVYDFWISRNRLLVISEDGKDIVEVSLPKDFQGKPNTPYSCSSSSAIWSITWSASLWLCCSRTTAHFASTSVPSRSSSSR